MHEFNEDAMGAALTEMRPLAAFEMTESCDAVPKARV